jgi:L,D-transpeptidase ErfK/SrfK
VVDQPIKLGWREGELFLEAHPSQKQFDELSLERKPVKLARERDEAWIKAKAGPHAADLDWPTLRAALETRTGVPVQITHADSHPVAIEAEALGLF